jgi:enoyl-CoA hydratase/carnithine racemase
VASVEFSVDGGVGWVRLNRPDRLNAMTNELISQASEAAHEAVRRPDVKVLVLTGNGRGFCSGADIKALSHTDDTLTGPGAPIALEQRKVQQLTEYLHRLPLPTIAAINGPAVGAGFELCLACDIRIMARSGYFQHAAMNHNLVAGDGSAYFLPRMIGLARALDLLLTERRVLADEAVAIGLAREVVPDEDLLATTQALAEKLAKVTGNAMQMTKEAVRISMAANDLSAVFSYLGLAVDAGKRARLESPEA